MDRFFPERELNDSGTYFQDALGSSEEESDDYEDNVIEEAETDAIAPAVFVSPKPRSITPQPPASVSESNEKHSDLPIEMNITSPIMPTETENGEIPKYPSLDDSASLITESAADTVENQPGTASKLFSWFGSFFGSNQSTNSPSSTPSPQPDASSSKTTETQLKEPAKEVNPKKSVPVAGTAPQAPTASTPVVPAAPVAPSQPQTVINFIFNGNTGDISSLPPHIQGLLGSALGHSQHPGTIPAPSNPTNTNQQVQPIVPSAPAVVGGGGPIPPPLPNFGGGPAPPPLPGNFAAPAISGSPSSMSSLDDEASPSGERPPETVSTPTPAVTIATPKVTTVTAEERKAMQKAAREAEKARDLKKKWVGEMQDIVAVCDRLRPDSKKEAVQYWAQWYDTNIPYANLLTTYYFPFLQKIPKQYDRIFAAIIYWENSLFSQLGTDLGIDEAAVHELRRGRCPTICTSEVDWFREKDKTEESLGIDRGRLLDASYTFCTNAIRQARQKADQDKLQSELTERLAAIKSAEADATPIEYDD